MRVESKYLRVSRVLSEDKDFAVIEVAKNDRVEFNLRQDEEGNTIGGDRFLTVLFIRARDGAAEVWDPWGGDA